MTDPRSKTEFPESLLTRGITSSLTLAGVSINVLTVAFWLASGAAFETHLRWCARPLGDFVTRQSKFDVLVGDRVELGTIAAAALAAGDVLSVSLSDASGQRLAFRLLDLNYNKAPGLVMFR